jgi:hypothetical protein
MSICVLLSRMTPDRMDVLGIYHVGGLRGQIPFRRANLGSGRAIWLPTKGKTLLRREKGIPWE